MIGGPTPIGLCLDEVVEIADGLYLGQLIYSTAIQVPFQSSVDPAEFKYQLFGYFLLLDDAWQHHRLAIGLDTTAQTVVVFILTLKMVRRTYLPLPIISPPSQ